MKWYEKSPTYREIIFFAIGAILTLLVRVAMKG